MKCKCSAVIDNRMKMSELAETISILGAELKVVGNTGFLEYEGEPKEVDRFIRLFEGLNRSSIEVG